MPISEVITMDKQHKSWSQDVALGKIKRYCDYQERCHKEVRYKLIAHKIYGDDLEDILVELIHENILNEERYAKALVRGKFRSNGWGKNKIRSALKFNDISSYLIKKAMLEISDEEYDVMIRKLLYKKIAAYGKRFTGYKLKGKLNDYMMQKGYSYFEYKDILDDLINEGKEL